MKIWHWDTNINYIISFIDFVQLLYSTPTTVVSHNSDTHSNLVGVEYRSWTSAFTINFGNSKLVYYYE